MIMKIKHLFERITMRRTMKWAVYCLSCVRWFNRYAIAVLFMTVFMYLSEIPLSAQIHADERLNTGIHNLEKGFFEQALSDFLEAADRYMAPEQITGRADALIFGARAHQMLGQHRKALSLLEQALPLKPQKDRLHAVSVRIMMADSHIFMDQAPEAEKLLNEAMALTVSDDTTGVVPSLLNTRGNLFFLRKMYREAMVDYRESMARAQAVQDRSVYVRAALNASKTLISLDEHLSASSMLSEAVDGNRAVPGSYERGFNSIEAGLLYQRLSVLKSDPALSGIAMKLLTDVADGAVVIANRRLMSHALGNIGRIHEEAGRYADALSYTRRAVFDAQSVTAVELLYLWHWQSGRILSKQGNDNDALVAYRSAVRSLQAVRVDSVPECQVFNQIPYDTVIEPISMGFIDLLLRTSASSGETDGGQQVLTEAIEVLETMKVAEMQDYLKDNCLSALQPWKTGLKDIEQQTAVVYPVSLEDRIEIVIYLQGAMKRISVPVGKKQFDLEIQLFRQRLEDITRKDYLIQAKKLYDWIISPIESELANGNINTILFVPQGGLRMIPLSALHDGKNFLIRKYSVATAQGFSLISPLVFIKGKTSVLSIGITEAVQGFPPLESVGEELDAIRLVYPGLTLKNNDVLMNRVEQELRDGAYSIVHFATHGEIGRTSKQTFLLAWDGKITMAHFEQFMAPNRYRRNPVELLVLSACQTAAGNDLSGLGLAGIGLKAGARSSLGTLWSVDDRSASALIAEFYRNLKDPLISKVKALQKAQMKLLYELNYQHPFYWAPFLLIGAWQ